ncbi:TPR repeat protein [Asanoa ferruginea]|uniref:TPR repeat protein n=1 Tax=Asanoa ferruginea TaxID=53367 RepID=A0A3D9ZSX2_9ACTN|nr:TPR repeat protein [Asanoa ferruginea]
MIGALATSLITILILPLLTNVLSHDLEAWVDDHPLLAWTITLALATLLATAAARVVQQPSRKAPPELTVSTTLDPLAMGVKPAVPGGPDTAPTMPTYVERDFDESLRWMVADGGFVCLRGPAAAGKTRSATEAIRRMCQGRRLFRPDGPAALLKLAGTANAVVWLDDLERFLGPGGLDTALLEHLCAPADVVVIATIRDAELAKLQHAAWIRDEGAPEVTDAGARLLTQLDPRRMIAVSAQLTDAERGRARSTLDDRVRGALDGEGGFGESLAAAPALLQRWSVGEGALFASGQAVISAAVDCRRAGYAAPVPFAVLDVLHRHYLPAPWRNRGDLPSLDAALEWASQPMMGASSCLIPLAGRRYLASDYLLDRTAAGAGPVGAQRVRAPVWAALSDVGDDHHLVTIGLAASQEQVYEVSERVWLRAAHHGNEWAMLLLGMLLVQLRRPDEAEEWLRRAVEGGCTPALGPLGYLFLLRGDTTEAERWMRQGATAGDVGSMSVLGLLLRRAGNDAEAERWLRKAADAGHPQAMVRLALLLAERGAVEEADQWAQRAVDAGHSAALTTLALLQQDPSQAEPRLRRAADAGRADAQALLATIYAERGELARAERVARGAAEAGDVMGMMVLHGLLAHRGATEEAEELLQEAARRGEPTAMTALGRRFAEDGDLAEAEAWLRRAADTQHAPAMMLLGALFLAAGRIDESREWFLHAKSSGARDAARILATHFPAGDGS